MAHGRARDDGDVGGGLEAQREVLLVREVLQDDGPQAVQAARHHLQPAERLGVINQCSPNLPIGVKGMCARINVAGSQAPGCLGS